MLSKKYNRLIRKSAVTELIVDDEELKVRIRSPAGVIRTVDTPFDPDHAIYVDFVVAEGRIWIRRVFDEHTPPAQGVVLDPVWHAPEWDSGNVRYGKAVYRSLSEGRWVVTVTGDGSLGLVRRDRLPEAELVRAPDIRAGKPGETKPPSTEGIGLGKLVQYVLGLKKP